MPWWSLVICWARRGDRTARPGLGLLQAQGGRRACLGTCWGFSNHTDSLENQHFLSVGPSQLSCHCWEPPLSEARGQGEDGVMLGKKQGQPSLGGYVTGAAWRKWFPSQAETLLSTETETVWGATWHFPSFPVRALLCRPGWSALAPWRFTAALIPWVQAILPP